MRNVRLQLMIFCTFTAYGTVTGQVSEFEIQNIIERFNKEVPMEPGCDYREYSLEDCVFSMTLECKGNEFRMYFNLDDIERVYKDKADMEDSFDTLFFVCNNGNTCISSNSEMIPPSPIFPVRLPEYKYSTLGEDAIDLFNSLIGNCK